MAYNYLALVNDVNHRLNEVQLTASNFLTAKGFYSQAKEAVNSALQDINHQQFEWPFNYVEKTETLLTGSTRYGFPADAKTIDMDTFRIKGDSTLDVETYKLHIISYEEYLEKFVDQEYTTDTSKLGKPRYVFRAPGLEFGVVPAPDKDYEIIYEYYTTGYQLINPTDVPAIPEIYRHVIIEGAMYYAYMFRSNEQAAVIAKEKFEKGLKNMRTILINRYDYVRSTALPQWSGRGNYVYRIKNA
jgi:hypothetical protein